MSEPSVSPPTKALLLAFVLFWTIAPAAGAYVFFKEPWALIVSYLILIGTAVFTGSLGAWGFYATLRGKWGKTKLPLGWYIACAINILPCLVLIVFLFYRSLYPVKVAVDQPLPSGAWFGGKK